MFVRTTRWIIAFLIGATAISVGCSRSAAMPARESERVPIVADDTLVHAFDTEMETRLVDRLQLDNFLRDRDIRVRVIDGTVQLTGEVWTSLERERVSELIRGVPGVIDVANELDIRPPA